MSLDDLASSRIETLTRLNDTLNGKITTLRQTTIKLQELIDKIGTTRADMQLLETLNTEKAFLQMNITHTQNEISKNNDTISKINSSIVSLSTADKNFSYMILTSHRFIPELFDFNVKQSFVDQVKSLYNNEDISEDTKKSIINNLLRRYDSSKYN